jgi:hypothetical protein
MTVSPDCKPCLGFDGVTTFITPSMMKVEAPFTSGASSGTPKYVRAVSSITLSP